VLVTVGDHSNELPLFVGKHIVFSPGVAMTNYLLPSPSDAKYHPDGENPITLKALQNKYKNKRQQKPRTKQTIQSTYIHNFQKTIILLF
jgi:hypothetical protein